MNSSASFCVTGLFIALRMVFLTII